MEISKGNTNEILNSIAKKKMNTRTLLFCGIRSCDDIYSDIEDGFTTFSRNADFG